MTTAIRILYVDDEPSLLDIGKVFLEDYGEFTVTTALSAPEGIRLLEQDSFDAIVSDYQMPGMDGIQFLVEVRARFGPIPFILFTGRGREEIVIQAINRGADFYLQKGGEPGAQFAELTHKIKAAASNKRANDALRRSEERYRNIVEDQTELISRFTPDGIHVFVNEAYCRYFGLKRDEILGHRFSPKIPKEDKERVQQFFASLTKEHKVDIIEQCIIMPNGLTKWQRWSDRAIFNDSGTLIEYQSVGRDITEIKQAEEELRKSEEKFRKAFFTSPDSICITRLSDGMFVSINKGFTEITGYTEEDVAGKTSIEINVWKDPEDRQKIVEELKAKGEVRNYEARFLTKTGEISGLMSTSIIELNGVPHILNITHDITERKVAEEALLKNAEELHASYEQLTASEEELRGNMDELARQEEALRESKRELADIIEFLPDATLAIDRQKRIIVWNKAIEQMSGIPAAEMIGKGDYAYAVPFYGEARPQLMDLVFEDSEKIAARYPAIRREGDALMAEVFCNALYNNKGAWVFAKASPLYDSYGNIVGAIESIRDITERKVLEDAVRLSEEKFRIIANYTVNWESWFGADGKYIWVSPSVAQFTGYSEVEILAMPDFISTVIAQEDRSLFTERFREAIRGTRGENFEFRYLHRNGSKHWLTVSWQPIFDTNGNSLGTRASGHDITDRKVADEELQKNTEELHASYEELTSSEEELRHNIDNLSRTERALRESETNLRAILDATPFPVALVDLEDNNINYWSRSALTLFGHTAPTADAWYQLAYPDPDYRQDVINRWKPYLEEAKRSGEPVNTGEYRVTCRDGTVRTCELYARFLADNLIVTFNDITERKVAVEALTENEERLRTTLEILPVGVFIFSKNGQILMANSMVNQIWGVTKGVVPHSSDMQEFVEYKGWWPDTGVALRPEDWAASRVLIKGEKAPVDIVNIRRFDGSSGTIIVSAVPYHDNRGNVTGAVAVIQDITESRRAEEALLKNTDELHAANEQLTATEEELRQNLDDISKNEKVLQESEDRFRGIFDTITSGVAIYEVLNNGASGKDYIIKDFNKMALEIEGKKKEEVVGKSLFDLRPTIDEYGLIPVFQQVWETGVPAYFPQKIYIDEKYSSWYENRVFRLHSGEIVAIYDDVTERKRAELELESALENLKEAHSLAHIGTWDWIIATDTVIWSEELYTIFRRDRSLPAPTYAEHPRFYSPASWEQLNDAVTRAFTTGETYNLELEMIRPDGSTGWVNALGGVKRDGNKKITGLHGTVQDITKRKLLDDTRAFLVQCGYPGSGEDFFNALARYLAERLDMSYVCIDKLEGDGLTAQTVAIYNDGKFDTNVRYALQDTPCGDVVGKTICCFQQEVCRLFPHDAALQDLKAESYVGTTLWSSGHTPIGLIAVIGRKPLKDPALAEAVLELVAVRAAGEMERKVAEEKLLETTEYLQNLFDYANAPIIVWDPEYVITRFNHAFEDLTLISEQEALGQKLDILFPEGSRDTSLIKIKKTLEGEQWKTVEIPILIKDGSVRTVLWNSANILDIHGRIISTIAQGVDITDRKEAGEALKERERDLVEAQKIAQLGKWELDLVNNTLHWSDGIYEMFEINPALFGATYEAFLDCIHPDDRDMVNSAYAGSLKNQQPYEISHRLRMGDGRIKWVNEICHTEYNAQGQPLRSVGIVQDISGIKQAEEALIFASRKLNLLSSITRHDINNQLTVLQGYLALLKKKQPDTSFAEYFLKINAAAERISAMILFTREYENIGVNAPVWQDCDTLIETATKQAPLGMVTVIHEIPAGTKIFADPLIVKVFFNLMDNAVRHGGKITTIRFFTGERGGDHLLLCEDDGEGVLPEEKEKIFLKGYGKNTGMGLFLSREILSITGITIRETSEPGKGARFEMTVPKGAYRFTKV